MPTSLLPLALDSLERIDNRYLGKGYRDLPAKAREAVATMQAQDLILEPVFTGKAMACLLDELPEYPNGGLLFWNTHDRNSPSLM